MLRIAYVAKTSSVSAPLGSYW